jgi:hypothetical protein
VKTFQVPATLEGVSLLKDGGVSLRYHTNELPPEEKTVISEYYQKFGWLLFSEQEHSEKELELEEIRKDIGGKTPSQRLRSVLYILHQQSGRLDLTFEQFYAEKMNRIIDQIKANLAD